MALFYVTGLSGSGKSTVLAELRARGYFARGVDEDGYAEWINRASGTADKFPHQDPDLDFHDWYRAHDWVLSARRIGALSRAATRLGANVFLCGVASGDEAVWHLFDQVAALVIDETTLKRRIANRTTNVFGKTPEELAAILRWQAGYEVTYRGLGAVIIDATQSLSDVVDEILTAAHVPSDHATSSALEDSTDTTITTKRLLLTTLCVADAEEVVHVLADPRLHTYIGGHPAELNDLRERYRKLEAGSPNPNEVWLNWILRQRDGRQAVGTIQATVIGDGATRTALIAWVIGTAWQRRGYASEAAVALVDWLRAQGVPDIVAHIHPEHEASATVAIRAGLQPTTGCVNGERIWRWAPPC